jgi:hypothetical protein
MAAAAPTAPRHTHAAPVARAATTTPVVQRHPVRATTPAPSVQASLQVSSPTDAAEREAASTAQRVVAMPAPARAEPPPWSARAGGPHVFRSPYIARFPSPTLMRQAGGRGAASTVAPATAGEIRGAAGGGSPLPPSVRGFMEPRFRADFSQVRIHTGPTAARLSRQIGAQAFTYGRDVFFGRDRFQPETGEGRELIAHELTHTIQQGAAVQRCEDPAASGGPAPAVVEHAPASVQRLGIRDALDFFAERANNIPGFRMFTIVLGVNPINMSRVERSTANIMRAVVEFIPGGGLITQALDNHGIFDRVAGWVDEQIRAVAATGASIRQAIDRFLDGLSWSDIFDLGGVWDRARRIFTDPIDRILSVARGLASGIIRFIKDAILRPLAGLAEGTRGYPLLKAVLGRDPITGDPVPRTAETLIGGFMTLIGQQEVWQNLQRANAVARAWAWFQGTLSGLAGFVGQIPGLFVQAFQSLELMDIVLLPRAFVKVGRVFGSFLGQFISWAGGQVLGLLQIIFEVLAPSVMPYLRRAAGAIQTIIRDPIRFVGNLVRAGIQGFRQFAANFLTHLRASLIAWLTGTLAGANIYIPQGFTLVEIVKFVLSVLGLTWQNIRQKLVRVVGETAVQALETGFDIVVTLVREGPAAAWERIRESLSNLREMVMEQIMSFVATRIVQAAITRLLTSLNPAGAFIQAVIAIYNTIMFFVERLRQIAQVVAAFIDSIAAIANGVIAAAAARVETTMAGLLTLVISFLARLVGLGRVSDAVTNIVNRIRAPIDRALDRVVEWIVAQARRLGRLVASGARSVAQRVGLIPYPQKSFSAGGESHRLYVETAGGRPRLTIASNPSPIETFLDRAQANASIPNARKARIPRARQLAQEINTTAAAVAANAALTEAQAREQLAPTLAKEEEMATIIQELLRGVSLAQLNEIYQLEGMVATYGAMPTQNRDRLTPDHQPQAGIIAYAAGLPIFAGRRIRTVAGGSHVNGGWAINLHFNRHIRGRTYGRQPDRAAVDAAVASRPGDADGQRTAVIGVLRRELRADVAAMRAVAGRTGDRVVWREVFDNADIDATTRTSLIGRVSGQILAGESRIDAQDLDSLARP